MAEATTNTTTIIARADQHDIDLHKASDRVNFGSIREPIDVPYLLGVQTDSFDWLIGNERWQKRVQEDLENGTNTVPHTSGLDEVFQEISPIENFAQTMSLTFSDPYFEEPRHTVQECKEKDYTYSAPLYVNAEFENGDTGEIKSQTVFMGDFPLQTPHGTFIIGGTERVIVSQLVRSPGVYFDRSQDRTSDKEVFGAKIIPSRGAWLEFEIDKRDVLGVRVDRKRKQSAIVFLMAIGMTKDEIADAFKDYPLVMDALAKETVQTQDEALTDLYRKIRPADTPTPEAGKNLLDSFYFNTKRYDLARVGRYKINRKLGLEKDVNDRSLSREDIIATIKYLVTLHAGETKFPGKRDGKDVDLRVDVDDIDHFGNRRIRQVGELIQNQLRTGLSRMERVVRERMTTQDQEGISPQSLINIKPVTAAVKEFFGSSQLSQFMDQNNPLGELTHKRRLSALGPGGLSRDRAGFEVRDVHYSHYGRMCPIETPEGPNIGLIGSLATYARINPYGFIETPYRRVVDGKVTDDIDYLTADEEENYTIAQANELFNLETREFGHTDEDGVFHKSARVLCRTRDANGVFGEPDEVDPMNVQYMDVSPRQMTSVATSLIPFLEHDDANRALMGSNMQRQAVPLLRPNAPLVGTGIEHRIAVDSGEILVTQNAGVVDYVDGQTIIVEREDGEYDEYLVPKFQRSNQSGCMNHKPIVKKGDRVEVGDVLADGPSCDGAELSLGQNLMVAYMPWEGFNYEDAIIISERVVAEDLLTSIHISEYEIDARDTKLGPEEITREIPNISEDMISDLDADGIIRIGAEVNPGDVLVGKVTPKGETELTAEERLLRAIFGEKAREVRDTSLKVPHGAGGRVINVVRSSRLDGDELAPGVNELVRVFVAQKRKIQQGDKLSGRHGNKGVISRILPVEDMPYLADGTPIDVILNPLGVPSRMNVGQLLECHLGWAAKWGWSDAEETDEVVAGPMHVATPVFDGATEKEISDVIEKANRNLVNMHKEKYGDLARLEFVPQLSRTGKTWLYDGRTGEKFREPITVGQSYILKLGHLVDDKIHARSTGPYSLITQQPLGGKAQFGGQRFGEMEVWALYSYGASNVLQEILTIKSDDTSGRVKSYEAIVKGESIPAPEVPESFKVLIKEMRSLCLNVELEGSAHSHSDLTASAEAEEMEEELLGAPLEPSSSSEGEELLGAITQEIDELLGGTSEEVAQEQPSDLIGEGEEN